MREAFEVWVKNPHMLNKSTAPEDAGEYTHPWTVGAWAAWQTATERAAQVCNQAMPQPVGNWSDAQIVEALRQCAAAIRAGS